MHYLEMCQHILSACDKTINRLTPPPPINQMMTALREFVVLMLLLWHFSGIILWDCPPCKLRDTLLTPFIGYINYFGFWQGWSVFEKPRLYNGYLTAVVNFKDGGKKEWEFPRMEKMNIIEKMFKERFRRWTNDCVSDESTPFLWPDAARYIARIHRNPMNPPVSVEIIRHWTWIDPPERGLGVPLRTTDDGQQTLYKGVITANDLE